MDRSGRSNVGTVNAVSTHRDISEVLHGRRVV
jgi:hypothetical protein